MKLILLIHVNLFGVMASQEDINFKQNDGSTFKANLQGDEWFNWVQTKDGYVAKHNHATKNYEYMVLENDELKSSNLKVRADVDPRPAGQVGVHRIAAPTRLNLPLNIKKISPEALNGLWKKARDNRHSREINK